MAEDVVNSREKEVSQPSFKPKKSRGLLLGIMLTYLGILILLVNFDVLYEDEAAALFFLGLGAGMILDYLAGQILPSFSRRSPAKLIFGFVFLLFGGSYFELLFEWWPAILIFVGILLIWRGSRKKPGLASPAAADST